jgi:hypothetical protein
MKVTIVSKVISGMPIQDEDLKDYALFVEQLQAFLLHSGFEVKVTDATEDHGIAPLGEETPGAIIFISKAMKKPATNISLALPGTKIFIYAGDLRDVQNNNSRLTYLNKYVENPFDPLLVYLQK